MTMVPRRGRTIMDDFAAHAHDVGALTEWLSKVVDGEVSPEVAVPPDVHPLDHFLGALDQHGAREQVLLIAEAAGELLLKWRFAHGDEITYDRVALNRLSGVLSLLEAIPAPTRVSSDLSSLSRLVTLGGAGPRGHDIRRQAMNALALRPPTELDAETMRQFWIALMAESAYAVASYGALKRLSLVWAVEELPRLMRSLGLGHVSSLQAVWDLFRDLESEPGVAQRLGEVMQAAPDLIAEVCRMLSRLRASERFPAASVAYQAGLASGQTTNGAANGIASNSGEQNEGRHQNRMVDPEVLHARHQLAAMSGRLLG